MAIRADLTLIAFGIEVLLLRQINPPLLFLIGMIESRKGSHPFPKYSKA
jgi:hypothetical protein